MIVHFYKDGVETEEIPIEEKKVVSCEQLREDNERVEEDMRVEVVAKRPPFCAKYVTLPRSVLGEHRLSSGDLLQFGGDEYSLPLGRKTQCH